MSDELILWIKSALRRTPGKTQAGLAGAIGVDASAVSKMLNGKRRIRASEIAAIANYLEQSPAAVPGIGLTSVPGLEEGPTPFAHQEVYPPLAPIYEVRPGRQEAAGKWLLLRNEPPIDVRPRAPNFAGSSRVFGLYAPDDAMRPRFRRGETVWIDPARPVSEGDDALFVRSVGVGRPEIIIIGEYRGAARGRLHYVQHAEPDVKSLPEKGWQALHALPRY